MGGLSISAWVILILGFGICFGGFFYCLLIAWGKEPNKMLERLGITRLVSYLSESAEKGGIYKPFEYMDRGPKEKGIGVLIVLILLITGWGLGVFDVEEAEAQGRVYLVDISWESATVAQESDYCNEGETHEYMYEITRENLLSVEIILSWDDDIPSLTQGDNDQFRLEVDYEWENDVPSEGSGSSTYLDDVGPLTFNRETTIPSPNETQLHSGDSAEEVKAEYTFTEFGRYYVNITCEDAGDRDPTPFGADDGNNYDLEIRVEYYEVTVTESHLPS